MGGTIRRWWTLLLITAALFAGFAPGEALTRAVSNPGMDPAQAAAARAAESLVMHAEAPADRAEGAPAAHAAAGNTPDLNMSDMNPSDVNTSPAAARAAKPPVTGAQAAALIDVASGRILYSHNGDAPLLIASLTKIMTAIVAIEKGELSDVVKVSSNAYGVEGSSIYLQKDEEISLQHLLYGLMLRSGNDAAVAIAEHVGGSVDGFVLLMNEKAREIGMTRSQFRNPHGLDAEGHYSTAEDMAMLTAYALKNPVFREIVKTASIKVPNPHEKWDRLWRNKNKMLHLYEGADGVKTGYTKAAGRCLVSSATRNGQQLVAVTLNDGSDWMDHRNLLDYGFARFPLHVIYSAGTVMERSQLASPHTFAYPLTEEERDRVEIDVRMTEADSLDARLGQRAIAVYRLNGEVIGRLPFYDADHPLVNKPKSGLSSSARLFAASADVRADEDVFAVMKRMFRALFDWRAG